MLGDASFAASCRTNARAFAPELAWSKALVPLVEFCRAPRRAPDLVDPEMAAGRRDDLARLAFPLRGWRADVAAFRHHLHDGGPRLLLQKIGGRLRRRVRERLSGSR
jgi:hypothetical protein